MNLYDTAMSPISIVDQRLKKYGPIYVTCAIVMGLAFLIAWVFVYTDWDTFKDGCNHRVEAKVMDQIDADVHAKCDLTLGWRTRSRATSYRETVVLWECDPGFSKPDDEEDAKSFPSPTCYKEGEEDLRVMEVDDYMYYDRIRRRYRKGRYQSDHVTSISKIRRLKRTWIALLVVWTVAWGSIVLFIAVKICVGIVVMSHRRQETDNTVSRPKNDAMGMLPVGFVKSDEVL